MYQFRYDLNPRLITYLSLFGLIFDVLVVAVDADVFEFTLRPTNGCSMQFLESSLFHSVTNDGYPCGVSALTWFRKDLHVVRSVDSKPVTSWNLAIEKMRFWYESSA